MAASVYADTSLLVSLYVQDAHSKRAVALVEAGAVPLLLTPLARHELRNAIRLCAFRRQITPMQSEAALHAIEDDIVAGMLHAVPLDWPKVLKQAETLGGEHTEALGARGMDILHVASAMALRIKRFITFDERQRQLAELAGLEVKF